MIYTIYYIIQTLHKHKWANIRGNIQDILVLHLVMKKIRKLKILKNENKTIDHTQGEVHLEFQYVTLTSVGFMELHLVYKKTH